MKAKTGKSRSFIFPKSSKLKEMENYEEYAKRIKKSLYYGKLPSNDRPSLPVTGMLVNKFGQFCKQDGFDKLNLHEASSICYDSCVTPCSVIVALLYLDRLRIQNPEYLAATSPSQVFVVALMVASKYLYDDGEVDEVFNDEWATSAAILLSDLNEAEKNFLSAIEWNLYVDDEAFMDKLLYVESTVAREQGALRGFFVYSDLVSMSNSLPPIWTSLLNLVGSALMICLVSYTATVFVVVAGSLATREYTIHVASQIRLNILPSIRTNVSADVSPFVPVDDPYETTLRNNFIENEKMIFELDEDSETEEEETTMDRSELSSLFLRFRALRTVTAALLLASSIKFNRGLSNDVSQFMLGNSFGCLNAPFPPMDLEDGVRNDPYSSYERMNQVYLNDRISDRLPRERRSNREWRKPKHTHSNNVDPDLENACPYNDFFEPSCLTGNSLPLPNNVETDDHEFSHAYLDYSQIVIEAAEDFLHTRLFATAKPRYRWIQESTLNYSLVDRIDNDSPFVSISRPFYHEHQSSNLATTHSPPSGTWDTLLPFRPTPRYLNYYKLEWKPENQTMVT